MDGKTLKIGVDIGGTNLRVGFVGPDLVPVDFRAWKAPGGDVKGAAARACRHILARTAVLEKKGHRVVRSIGVSAPGAYLKDGRVYPGTVPNLPQLEKTALYRLFARGLGPGWRVTPAQVNNDGVVQGLVMAARFAAAHKMRQGTVVAVIPGTGLGAGVCRVKGGVARPVPGPQQLFDVVVRGAFPGEALMDGRRAKGGEPLMAEHLVSGRALERLARGAFGRPVGGGVLSGWALGKGPRAAAARALFRQAGEDLSLFVRKVQSGRYRKACVPFRPDARGARFFLLGGRWFLEGAGRRISLPAARKALGKAAVLLPSDKVPGLRRIAPFLGVAGASLLIDDKSFLSR